MSDNGALCQMQVKLQYWRQTDRQTDIVIACWSSHYVGGNAKLVNWPFTVVERVDYIRYDKKVN